jgi:hypothetical protein
MEAAGLVESANLLLNPKFHWHLAELSAFV